MTKRKLLIAIATAALAVAGLGASVLPAAAEQKTLRVTLVTGQVITCVVDVSVDICPGVTGPVADVVEIPIPSTPATPQVPTPTTPAPPSGGGGGGGDTSAGGEEPRPGGGGGEQPRPRGDGKRQESTGEKKRRGGSSTQARGEVEAGGHGHGAKKGKRKESERGGNGLRDAGGAPTLDNPTLSLAVPGAAPIGVPNFFIDKFRIPPFLLSIYQAAGIEYGVRWEVLAAINEIETDYGRNLNVSSAGALGWMQFMPATWKAYGVDANGDRKKDPYNPVDAIFAAARYLKAAGGHDDLRKAVFAYNHADWYVDSVLMRARLIGGLPVDLVGSLTGLTQGRFPVAAKARYADDLAHRRLRRVRAGGNAAVPVESSATRRGVSVFAAAGSAVIATHDGRIVRRGVDERLGRFVQVRDAYGNTYTYGHLATLAPTHPVARRGARPAREEALPAAGPRPRRAASAGRATTRTEVAPGRAASPAPVAPGRPVVRDRVAKERLFALPARPEPLRHGGAEQVDRATAPAPASAEPAAPAARGSERYVRDLLGLRPDQVTWKQLRPGSAVVAGTVLGRVGRTRTGTAPHTLFEIRPAGRGAPRIDPKPILDGWKLLESTAIYRARGRNPFSGRDAEAPSIGQILLMSKESLQQRVLANPKIDVYDCGRQDIRAGRIDRRVLATLEFLAANGLRPTVTSLVCGHGTYTASGNVSHHTTGTGVDIAKVNGIPMLGNQGAGSITDIAVRRLLTLQGAMKPAQIITLMQYPGTDNTVAMGDHHDHIHLGWRPRYDGSSRTGGGGLKESLLEPDQWYRVIDRLKRIDNPRVVEGPARRVIRVRPRARAPRP